MRCIYFLGSACLLLLLACQSPIEEEPSTLPLPKASGSAPLHLLLFKKEQRLEVWQQQEQWTLLQQASIRSSPLLPIGQFMPSIASEQLLQFEFPNTYYQTKKDFALPAEVSNIRLLSPTIAAQAKTASQLLIFPSDIRQGGIFAPCFACPHWIAELYSQLSIELQQYPPNPLSQQQ